MVENQAGKAFDYFTTDNATTNSQIINKIIVSYNAKINSSRKMYMEPDGRTKVICIIPDCTDVQLGEIVGKYVSVTFLNDGKLQKGWCINNNFITKEELP